MTPKNRKKTVIGVIGGRQSGKGLLGEARKVGRLAAEAGAIVVTGGLGGIMEAASRGAKEAGGTTLGILPYDSNAKANRYVDVPVATGFGIGRNIVIARTADALIAVDGQYGTLSEIAFSLQMGKPVVGIGTWEIEGVVEALDAGDAVRKAFDLIGKKTSATKARGR